MGNLKNINSKALLLINVVLGQTLLVLTLAGYQNLWAADNYFKNLPWGITLTGLFTMAAVILTVLGVWLIRVILDMSAKEAEAEANAARLQESQEFIEVLRSHRHDFLNHLQVISGLLDLGMNDQAKRYIWELAKEIKGDKGIRLVDHAEINALLIKKWASAEENRVTVGLDVKADLKTLDIPPYDLTRILGNLIENAIQATTQIDIEDRKVEVGIYENQECWIFTVRNQLPIIPPDLQKKIFERGFSTKGSRGRGLGLDIVCRLLEKYDGSIELVSEEGKGTIFTVQIPKNSAAAL